METIELALILFVPPLLFSDGWLFPKREFDHAEMQIVGVPRVGHG
jgi:NhaP-type Na+/H+ or K+/H+ antiporter